MSLLSKEEDITMTCSLKSARALPRRTGGPLVPEVSCLTSLEYRANAAFLQQAVQLPKEKVSQLSHEKLTALPLSLESPGRASEFPSACPLTKVFITFCVALNLVESGFSRSEA